VPRGQVKMCERKRAYRGGEAAPSEAWTHRVLLFPLKTGFLLKKAEKPFDFSLFACKLCFGIAFPTFENPVSSSLHRLFQQKHM
jgi:hypothetical protein